MTLLGHVLILYCGAPDIYVVGDTLDPVLILYCGAPDIDVADDTAGSCINTLLWFS